MLWLIVTHTFKRNELKLAEWSKWTCITLWSCFCRVLTSNWKVSTGSSPQSFIIFIKKIQNFVIILYIEDIETNLPIGKRVLYEILKRLFQKFVSTFNLCVCFYLLHFVSLFNELCRGFLSHIHLRIMDQGWQTGPNESVLHFEVVFVIFWQQIGKLVERVLYTFSLILLSYKKFRPKFVHWRHWNKPSIWGAYLVCIYMNIWKDCWQNSVWVFHLCVCVDL